MTQPIRTYLQQHPRDTVDVRQFDDTDLPLRLDDDAVSDGTPNEGTWIVEARFDGGQGRVVIDLADLLAAVASTQPDLLRQALAGRQSLEPIR